MTSKLDDMPALRGDLARWQHLVNPAWLACLIAGQAITAAPAGHWRLFEVGFEGAAPFLLGHIPGATYLDTNQLEGGPLWNKVPDPELLRVLLEHGIRHDSTVVLYGRNNLAAARAQRGASAELGAQGAILAPATGRVLVADVPVGSVVMPGQTLAKITAGPMVVRIQLPEGQARALKVGDVVQLAAEDMRGVATQGTIAQVYPSVTGGQVTADVSAPGLPQDLIGQRVRAQIKVGARQALIVPRTYVVTRFGIDYARLVRADNTVSETPIQTTAGPTAAKVEVLSGLRAGDVLTPAGTAR